MASFLSLASLPSLPHSRNAILNAWNTHAKRRANGGYNESGLACGRKSLLWKFPGLPHLFCLKLRKHGTANWALISWNCNIIVNANNESKGLSNQCKHMSWTYAICYKAIWEHQVQVIICIFIHSAAFNVLYLLTSTEQGKPRTYYKRQIMQMYSFLCGARVCRPCAMINLHNAKSDDHKLDLWRRRVAS